MSPVSRMSPLGFRRQIQAGYPGTKVSGNTISEAPASAASPMEATAFAIVLSRFNSTGGVWTTAALKVIAGSPSAARAANCQDEPNTCGEWFELRSTIVGVPDESFRRFKAHALEFGTAEFALAQVAERIALHQRKRIVGAEKNAIRRCVFCQMTQVSGVVDIAVIANAVRQNAG